MAEGSETPGGERSSGERISRAREIIDRSYEELAARGASPGEVPPGPPPGHGSLESTGDRSDSEFDARIAAAAEAIDRRVGEMVSARLDAAEQRIELQTKAVRAALGEEAVQARLAIEQVERVRASLRDASEASLRDVEHQMRGRDEIRAEVEQALKRLRDGAARAGAHAAAAAMAAAEEEITRRLAVEAPQREEEEVARVESRINEITAHLAGEADRRVKLQVGAARAEIEAASNERVDRFERDFAARVKTAEARLTAMGGARLAEETQRIELIGAEIEERMRGAAEDLNRIARQVPAIAAERAASVAELHLAGSNERIGEVDGEVARLWAELELQKTELSKRSLRRERSRLEEEGTAQLRRLGELAEVKRGEFAEAVAGEAGGASARVRSELADELRAAREQLETIHAGARAELEEAVEARSRAAVASALRDRIRDLEERVAQTIARGLRDAEERLDAAATEGELRLAAADRAQEREEAIKLRAGRAEAAAEARVRAAEQRLVDVLAQLDRATRGGARATPSSS